MKIKVKCHGMSIEVKGLDEHLSKKEIANVVYHMYDAIKSVYFPSEDTEDTNKNESIQIQTPKEPDLLIRPRIPNSIVDTKDLDIKQAVTENALVRCPECGQSHILAVNSGNHIYVMRKFYAVASSDEFRIIAEFDSLSSQDFINMCCKPETNRKAYFEDIQKIKMIDDKDFAVDNNTEIFCPVCCRSHNFGRWKDAYENPLKYFETEHLCDACGGERFEKVIKNGKLYECDTCGLIIDHTGD